MFRSPGLIALIGVFAVGSLCCAAEIQTLAGQKHTGELVSIDGQSAVFKTASGDVTIPVTQLLAIDISPESDSRDKFTEVELSDGSVLHVSSIVIKADRCEMKLIGGPIIQAPFGAVTSILRDAQDTALKQEWTALLRKRGPLDLLVVRSEGKLDALEGTAGQRNAAGDAIEFSLSSGEKVTTKLSRAQGFVFVRKPDPNSQPSLCRVRDTSGTDLIARTIRLDGAAITIDTVAGASVTYPAVKQLSRLDFSKGKLTYLSDLEPADKDESSTEDLVFPYRRDRNLYGGMLRIKGVTYARGLALHSRSVLTYDIGSDYREFRAMVGVDDAVRTENGAPVRVLVLIEADGRELFKGEIRTGDEPKTLALDVKGVRRLRLTVVSPGLDLGNQVDFCDARVSK
ncbi:MAG: NPCBM/NEW2 domain-containing protein [Gemmataceae bacterium]